MPYGNGAVSDRLGSFPGPQRLRVGVLGEAGGNQEYQVAGGPAVLRVKIREFECSETMLQKKRTQLYTVVFVPVFVLKKTIWIINMDVFGMVKVWTQHQAETVALWSAKLQPATNMAQSKLFFLQFNWWFGTLSGSAQNCWRNHRKVPQKNLLICHKFLFVF